MTGRYVRFWSLPLYNRPLVRGQRLKQLTVQVQVRFHQLVW